MKRILPALMLFVAPIVAVAADQQVLIGVLVPAAEGPAADLGLAGARLGVDDDNTTGKFLGQRYALAVERLAPGGDALAAARRLEAGGAVGVISLLAAPDLLKAAAAGSLILNAASEDESLRNENCRPNLRHVAPDRAMLADALAQYLIRKRWSRWLLVVGDTPGDQAMARAVRRAAGRFGAKIAAEKAWTFNAESKPENEIPVFTQGADYDIVIVADEPGRFGSLLPYRLWLARPVAGSAGLVAKAWDPTAEEWGATQLQNRFRKQAGRPMQAVDYTAWLAARIVGEAAARARAVDAASLRKAIAAPGFAVAGFKGRQLSFRDWDGQLRQPIFLAGEAGVVAVAPVEGFLHPLTELDTLGTDRPESHCKAPPS